MDTQDTFVFYMCIQKLYHIMDKLIMNKKNIYTDKLIDIVEKATNPMHKVYTIILYNFKNMIKKEKNFL
ncbi:hypothetical protein [Blattabacterium clevelandi]|uniref:hypothetical protein n=1 Tax=Blattabacterium clevelandi TaxID=164516 RepID=UPI001F34CEC5|nr:hypothetical protein [Blattabacterium clevelandi]